MALLGAGAVLAVLLLIPGGGTIAGPVHDGFFTVLGVGAWLVAAGFGVTGARLLQGHEWRGGLLAGIGSLVTVLAILGFLGLAFLGSAPGLSWAVFSLAFSSSCCCLAMACCAHAAW